MPEDEKTFDVFCPQCNILVSAKVIARGFGEYRSDEPGDLDDVDREYHGEHYSVAICKRCDGPFLVRESLYTIAGEFESVTVTVLFPTSRRAEAIGAPESVTRALEQADRAFQSGLYDACALMCRRALEATCKVRASGGRDLAKKLQSLREQGHVDEKLLNWAHGVRVIGNEAAHDVDTAVSLEDARDALEFTVAFVMYVFTLDQKYSDFQARRRQREDGENTRELPRT